MRKCNHNGGDIRRGKAQYSGGRRESGEVRGGDNHQLLRDGRCIGDV